MDVDEEHDEAGSGLDKPAASAQNHASTIRPAPAATAAVEQRFDPPLPHRPEREGGEGEDDEADGDPHGPHRHSVLRDGLVHEPGTLAAGNPPSTSGHRANRTIRWR